MNDDKNNPAILGPDIGFKGEEENLSLQLNNLQIKKKVSVKWSDNIIDNENLNHNSKIATRKKTPIKKKNKIKYPNENDFNKQILELLLQAILNYEINICKANRVLLDLVYNK